MTLFKVEDLPDKIIPHDNVLWYILNCIFEIKPVLVTKDWSLFALVESYIVHGISKGQVSCIFWEGVELFSEEKKC